MRWCQRFGKDTLYIELKKLNELSYDPEECSQVLETCLQNIHNSYKVEIPPIHQLIMDKQIMICPYS